MMLSDHWMLKRGIANLLMKLTIWKFSTGTLEPTVCLNVASISHNVHVVVDHGTIRGQITRQGNQTTIEFVIFLAARASTK